MVWSYKDVACWISKFLSALRHFLVQFHIYTSWFRTFLFPLHLFFCFFLSIFISSISPPPSDPVDSAACVEECLLFPLSAPSSGASKGGGPMQGVWRAHRPSPMGGELADAQTTQLYLDGRSILLICFCTAAIGFPCIHETDISFHRIVVCRFVFPHITLFNQSITFILALTVHPSVVLLWPFVLDFVVL